jgi:hypothetical protein
VDFSDFFAALCMVLVIEGLFLLAAPGTWKRIAAQLTTAPESALRMGGGMMIVAGLISLQLVR